MSVGELLDITLRTLAVAGGATLLIAVPGAALGWLLARRRFRGRALVQTLVALPMVLPPVAVGLLLLLALSPRSAFGAALAELLGPILLTPWAAMLAAAVMSFPLLVRGAEQAFAAVPLRCEQVAASLGASRATILRRVTLPLAARGLTHGLVFAFARALGEFGATTLVAGHIPGRTETLALGIYARIEAFREGEALALVGVATALAFAVTYAAEAALAKGSA